MGAGGPSYNQMDRAQGIEESMTCTASYETRLPRPRTDSAFGYYLQVGRIKRKIKKNQFIPFTKGVKIKKNKNFGFSPRS